MPSSKNKPKISVIIADDHTFFREGLVKVLQIAKRFQVVGEASNGEELIALAIEHQPNVLIVDINMPVLNGIEAIHKIASLGIPSKVIGLTMHTDNTTLLKMLNAGAMSILDKNTSKDELYEAIDSLVLHNRLYFPAATNAKMLSLLSSANVRPAPDTTEFFTERELDVIRLVCADFANKEIADQLELSPRTVESHRVRIMEKMGVKSVAGLVAYAFSHGLVQVDKTQ